MNEIYHDLISTTEKVSQVFGFGSMLGTCLCFLYSLNTFYLSYKAFFDHEDELIEKAFITVAFWLFIEFYFVLIFGICEATRFYVNNFYVLFINS